MSEHLSQFDDPLIRPGDQLQSAASRLAEWVLNCVHSHKRPVAMGVPYEVHMAALEAQSAADEWTDARLLGRDEGYSDEAKDVL